MPGVLLAVRRVAVARALADGRAREPAVRRLRRALRPHESAAAGAPEILQLNARPRHRSSRRSSPRSTPQLRVDEEAFVALMRHLAEQRLGRLRRLRHDRRGLDADRRGAARRWSSWRSRERPRRRTIIAGTGSNDTPPRGPPDRARRPSSASTRCCRSRPTTTARAARGIIAPLRGGRRRHRQADRALQHPAAHRHQHAARPARRARADRRHRRRQAGQRRRARADRRARRLRRRRRPASRARSTSAAPAGSASPATSSATRCAGWSTSPSAAREIDASLRDVYETLFMTASPTCTKAALNLLGHDVGGLRLPLVRGRRAERDGGARDARAPRPAARQRAARA